MSIAVLVWSIPQSAGRPRAAPAECVPCGEGRALGGKMSQPDEDFLVEEDEFEDEEPDFDDLEAPPDDAFEQRTLADQAARPARPSVPFEADEAGALGQAQIWTTGH